MYDGKQETPKKQAGKRKRALDEEATARKKIMVEAKSTAGEKTTTGEEATPGETSLAEDIFESDASRAFRLRQEELVTGVREKSSAAPTLQMGLQDQKETNKTDWELLDDAIHERHAKRPRK